MRALRCATLKDGGQGRNRTTDMRMLELTIKERLNFRRT